MSRLTSDQLQLLRVLAEHDYSLSGPQLVALAAYDTSPEGIHRTAASLSRRGLVLKNKEYRLSHPKVVYSITPAGRHTLAEEAQKKSRFKK